MIKNILADLLIIIGLLMLIIGIIILLPNHSLGEDETAHMSNLASSDISANIVNNSFYKSFQEKLDLKYTHDTLFTNNTIKKNNLNKMTNSNLDLYNMKFAWQHKFMQDKQFSLQKNEITEIINENKKKVKIEIKAGMSSKDVGNMLEKKEIIDRDSFMRTLVVFGVEKKIRPGKFTFRKNSDILEVFSKILLGGGENID